MKSKIILLMAMLAIILTLASGCTKTATTVFTWDYGGFHYVADSASAAAGADSRIVAVSGTRAVAIEPAAKVAVGSYPLGAANNPSYLIYINVGNVFSQTGTLTITYVDNTKMSGSFSATLQDGTSISGAFTDIPIK
jgi:hypothetical protein